MVQLVFYLNKNIYGVFNDNQLLPGDTILLKQHLLSHSLSFKVRLTGSNNLFVKVQRSIL